MTVFVKPFELVKRPSQNAVNPTYAMKNSSSQINATSCFDFKSGRLSRM